MSLRYEPASQVANLKEEYDLSGTSYSGSEEGSFLKLIDFCVTQL